MNRHATLMLLWITACSANLAAAADDAPQGFTRSLFDGRTLDGWQVTGCEAVVQDGAILLKSGNGLVRTDHRYSDFVLELDWKALGTEMWDSGIFFRCPLPPQGVPWPKDYQVNLRKGMEGNVGGLEGAQSEGLTKPGEWNHFKLTVAGTTAALAINGRPAWKADGLKRPSGYIALQAEVPGGGQFLFRNLQITELGYAPLVNGRDLSGWQQAGSGDCWQIEDGLLTCTGQRGSWLRSARQYGDFNLRLQYKLEPGGNSGVYIRVPESGNHHGQGAGIEVQVLDDAHPRYAKLKPYQFTASLYAILPAAPRVARPAGQWNSLEIDCHGRRYRVVHNGTVVVETDAEKTPELQRRLTAGFLGLQNHSSRVWYRDLRIGPPQPE